MKSMIAKEIDIDPNDELKCLMSCEHYVWNPYRCNLFEYVRITDMERCQECLDAETVMMLKTHCKGEED